MIIQVLLLTLATSTPILEKRERNQRPEYYTQHGFQSPENSFQLDINCGPLNETKCDEFKTAAQTIATKIGRDLVIRLPVTVNLTLTANTVPTILRQVSKYVAGKRTTSKKGPLRMYPRSLIKQKDVTEILPLLPVNKVNHVQIMSYQYPGYDIEIELNAMNYKMFNPESQLNVDCNQN